jgi:hypothetical protein
MTAFRIEEDLPIWKACLLISIRFRPHLELTFLLCLISLIRYPVFAEILSYCIIPQSQIMKFVISEHCIGKSGLRLEIPDLEICNNRVPHMRAGSISEERAVREIALLYVSANEAK